MTEVGTGPTPEEIARAAQLVLDYYDGLYHNMVTVMAAEFAKVRQEALREAAEACRANARYFHIGRDTDAAYACEGDAEAIERLITEPGPKETTT